MKTFICGSISIKNLNNDITQKIDEILNSQHEILIGDAEGVDSLVQKYLSDKNYTANVTIYHIYDKPRNKKNDNFKTRKINYDDLPNNKNNQERKKQAFKDKKMIKDCDCCYCVWDGKSKGSYENIKESLEQKKEIQVYYSKENKTLKLTPNQESKNQIAYIYESNNGYSIKEIYNLLKENYKCGKNEEDFRKKLIENQLIKTENKKTKPMDEQDAIPQIYKGVISSYRFKECFIKKIEKIFTKSSTLKQYSFDF